MIANSDALALESRTRGNAERVAERMHRGMWLPAVLAAAIYPVIVRAFFLSVQAAKTASGIERVALVLCLVVLFVFAFAAPCLVVRGLLGIAKSTSPEAPRIRRTLHVAFAVPPLYLLSMVTAYLSGLSEVWPFLWWGGWSLVIVVLWWMPVGNGVVIAQGREPQTRTGSMRISFPRWRRIHRIGAVALILSFVALHLGNHLVAFWSVPANQAVMDALRIWYRAAWIEPFILSVFALMAATGIGFFIRYTRLPSDKWRVVQIASGVYLSLFVVNHVYAVLSTRDAGRDTDWVFATGGPAGMLGTEGYVAVSFYYILALLAVCIHIATGLRMGLLARRVSPSTADRAAIWISGVGAGVTIFTIAALLGVQFGARS